MKYNFKFLQSIDDIHLNGVYKLYHISDPDQYYIGSASTNKHAKKYKNGFYNRMTHHMSSLRSGRHNSKGLQSIFDCNGHEGMIMEIIEICEPVSCRSREQYYLNTLNPPMNTYKDVYGPKGHKFSDEVKKKLSIAKIGRQLTEETKRKVSEALKGKTPANLSLLRTPLSRKKAADAIRGVPKTSARFFDAIRTPVKQYTKGGEFVKEYDSIREAVEETGTASSSISQCLVGVRGSAGGFLWRHRENGHLESVHQKQNNKDASKPNEADR